MVRWASLSAERSARGAAFLASSRVAAELAAETSKARRKSLMAWVYNDFHVKRPASGSDRKSTRLNSSHTVISYAVFCLKKKKHNEIIHLLIKNTKLRLKKNKNTTNH